VYYKVESRNGGVKLQELFREMVETHSDKIFRLALRYTGERAQAEDLAQETFLRAYKNLASYDRSKPAGPWLCTIAANLCRNWLRDNRELPFDFTEESFLPTESGPEELYLQKESETEVLQALEKLPLIYREVLLLRHVGELSYGEIAEALKLELSIVKNRLYRGRLMLKESLIDARGGK
jgi:RNA polymerase sigma-70 factor, ECF subfamily